MWYIVILVSVYIQPLSLCTCSTASAPEGRKVAYVELLRRSSEPLGLVVEGGKDRNQKVHISHLRPGGVAEK